MIDRGDSKESVGDEMQRRYDLAGSREEKLRVLSDYMGPKMAFDALGFMEGDHRGDTINLGNPGRPWGKQADPRVPGRSPIGGVMIAGTYHPEGQHLSPEVLAHAGPAALAKIRGMAASRGDPSRLARAVDKWRFLGAKLLASLSRIQRPKLADRPSDVPLGVGRAKMTRFRAERLESGQMAVTTPEFLHRELDLQAGDEAEITVHARINMMVMLLDPGNFSRYKHGLTYHDSGGRNERTLDRLPAPRPGRALVRLPAPRPGRWHVVVNLDDCPGTVRAGVRIIREPMASH